MSPPLSLVTVAAILPQDWTFKLVDQNVRPVQESEWQWAEMVLLSGMISQKEQQLKLIAEGKRRGIPIVIGGAMATSTPEVYQAAGVDFLVLDEGEVTIPKFLKALEAGATKGVFRSEGVRPDMTQSPIPRFDLLDDVNHYLHMHVQFSQGCPFLCEFCDIPPHFGHLPRTKHPQQIVEEFKILKNLGWQGTVFIADDNFIGHKKTCSPDCKTSRHGKNKTGTPLP